MARRVRTVIDFYDDLSKQLIPEGEAETLYYMWDGVEYEIDLTRNTAEQLREFMNPIVNASRRIGGRKVAHRKAPAQREVSARDDSHALPSGGSADGEVLSPYQQMMAERAFRKEVREWAVRNGYSQGSTGWIKPEVRDAWNAAHPDRPVPEAKPHTYHRRPAKGENNLTHAEVAGNTGEPIETERIT